LSFFSKTAESLENTKSAQAEGEAPLSLRKDRIRRYGVSEEFCAMFLSTFSGDSAGLYYAKESINGV